MSLIVLEGSHGVGKSSTIRELNNMFDIITLKSVPDWYRKYIPFARSMKPEIQKKIYMIGHEAIYNSLDREHDYFLDRFFYTTIIRLNYELKRSVDETIDEILAIPFEPNAVIYLFPNKEILLKRLMYRNDLNLYDEKFYKYENEVLFKLSMVYDKIIIVNNNMDFSTVIPTINKELIKRKIYLKKRN